MSFLSIFYHGLHLLVIGLNAFGWTLPRLRLPSFICQLLTLACWVGFGLFKGWWGFCPLTYLHWQELESLGVMNLPQNYITYIVKLWFGVNMNSDFAAGLVAGVFGMALMINISLLRRKVSR